VRPCPSECPDRSCALAVAAVTSSDAAAIVIELTAMPARVLMGSPTQRCPRRDGALVANNPEG
jgi:hypothetical protein